MTDGGLRAIWRKHLPQMHWQSIETPLTGKGVPDMNYCHSGKEGWVENKVERHKRVHIRPEQVGWIERRFRAGGRVFVAVRGRPADGLWLYGPAQVRLLMTSRLDTVQALGYWAGAPAKWDWLAIAALLASDSDPRRGAKV